MSELPTTTQLLRQWAEMKRLKFHARTDLDFSIRAKQAEADFFLTMLTACKSAGVDCREWE